MLCQELYEISVCQGIGAIIPKRKGHPTPPEVRDRSWQVMSWRSCCRELRLDRRFLAQKRSKALIVLNFGIGSASNYGSTSP